MLSPSAPATLDVVRVDNDLDGLVAPDARLERVAGGFEFTEGPVWTRDGALLFSSPNTNAIYRWTPQGTVTVFRSHSGYTGADIGRYHQPGSNGLTFDPDGRLTMCQHGNRRILRVEPHGNTTVLADRFEGNRLNSPNDLVYRSDGTLYFTDPPFGLPDVFDDPEEGARRSPACSGSGTAASARRRTRSPARTAWPSRPDERFLYVGNWDPDNKVVMRYDVDADGSTRAGRSSST